MFLLGFLSGSRAQTDSAVSKLAPVVKAEAYGKLPLSFEANHGQTDAQVRFLSRGNGYSLFLTDTAAVLSLRKGEARPKTAGLMGVRASQPLPVAVPKTDVVRMELAGARHGLRVEGAEKLPGTANYFIGNDPAKWRSAVPTYAKVRYGGVYPGVDLVYYGNQSQLEYDFVVAPHADARPIRLRFAGARRLKLDANGNLAVIARNGEIAFHKPVVYQEHEGKREAVEGCFALLGKNEVGFSLGSYDHARAVVIDPVLAYSTYLGGSLGSSPAGIAADESGSVYVVGSTASVDFPLLGAEQTVNHNGVDMFVTKLNPAGNALVYSTFIGGSGYTANGATQGDAASTLAIDASGNVFICGETHSSDFPITPGAFQTSNKIAYPGEATGFVTKLNATGSSLVYSTYLGGSGSLNAPNPDQDNGDNCTQLALDSTGNAYVVGGTTSPDFPTTPGAYQTTHALSGSGFVTKLNPSGSAPIYSTLLLGAEPGAITLDAAGDAFLGGVAYSVFQPTPGALQAVDHVTNGAATGFVAKLNPAGSSLIYGTFLGGSGYVGSGGVYEGDGVTSIAVDGAGEVYASGATSSNDFPVTSGAFQSINLARNPANPAYTVAVPDNIFVTKLNAAGTLAVFSTYLGSSAGDFSFLNSTALDTAGNLYLTGTTYGIDFPVSGTPFQKSNNSAGHPLVGGTGEPLYAATNNAVLVEFSPSGSLLYSTYYGGGGYFLSVYFTYGYSIYEYLGDGGAGLARDPSGNVYLIGSAASPDFPTTGGAYQATNPAHVTNVNPVAATTFIAKFNFNASSSSSTLTALTSDALTQNAGATVTFTAHVQSLSGGGILTGTVAFTVDGEPGGSKTLDSNGRATLTSSTLTMGTHTVVASYSGDSTYTGSISPPLTESIVLMPANIAVVSGAGQSAAVGTALAQPVVVKVTNVNGVAVPNATVSFAGTGLKFSISTVVTNSLGQASVTAMPVLKGVLPASASVAGTTPLFVLFTENGVATPVAMPPGFASMAILPTGASAAGASLQAAVGDFNGDGLADLATTNTIDASVSVLQGKGDGTFKAAVNYGTGAGPYGVAAGDFNGDGKADLAVVNGLDGTVSVLLNSASGLPATPSFTYAVGSQPYGVSAADLNRDGALDLVVTNNASNSVSVLLGKGDGSFQGAVTYAVGNTPFGTAVADLNRDGYPDLVVWNYGDNTVGVLLNTTAGTFSPQTTYAAGPGPFSVTTGDFNGDGYPDLAVALLGTKASVVGANAVKVLLNNKAGGFAAGVSYAVGTYPTAVLAQDLNGDGVLDLATTNLASGTVSVLVGKGDGTFLAQTVYQTGSVPYGLAAGDFNGDGKADLAVTNIYSNSIGVLLQSSSTTASKTKGLPPRTLKTDPQ